MKPLRLAPYLTFCRSFAPALLALSAACIWVLASNGPLLLAPAFYFKIATTAVVWYFVNEQKRREYYYYFNLGIRKRRLWLFALTADLLVFIISVIITLSLWNPVTN